MKTYDKYKDSGVEWIGDVPNHWDTLRLRFVCELRNGYTPSKANPDFWNEGTIPWYRMEDIRESGRRLKEAKQYVTESAIKGGGLFDAGSYIMATTATIGEHAMLIVDSLANQRFTNLKIRKSLSHSDFKEFFFQYLFVVDDYCKTTTKTATFPAVNMEDLKNFIVCIPPISEQKQILAYLDKKCADIDKVIATQQRRIELLQELKQSTITHAVTHGLDPNIKMKDSGVEWIGEVPEHWRIMHLKFLVYDYKAGPFGSSLITSNLQSEGEILVYNPEHVAKRNTDLDNNLYLPLQRKEEMKQFFLKENDIIFPIVGSLGRAMIISNTMPQGIINQRLARFQLSNKLLNNYFMWIFADSDFYKPYIELYQRGSIIVNLTKEIVYNMPIILPPLTEQQAIATYLDKKCTELDNSISKAQREIDLLQEYKQSLITEVVTGKRKVC